ncbi:MAG: hypothetical protein ACXAC7_16560, partial [Candidatus Hodarchaeales archaeon]
MIAGKQIELLKRFEQSTTQKRFNDLITNITEYSIKELKSVSIAISSQLKLLDFEMKRLKKDKKHKNRIKNLLYKRNHYITFQACIKNEIQITEIDLTKIDDNKTKDTIIIHGRVVDENCYIIENILDNENKFKVLLLSLKEGEDTKKIEREVDLEKNRHFQFEPIGRDEIQKWIGDKLQSLWISVVDNENKELKEPEQLILEEKIPEELISMLGGEIVQEIRIGRKKLPRRPIPLPSVGVFELALVEKIILDAGAARATE